MNRNLQKKKVDQVDKQSTRKGCFSQGHQPVISALEQEVLYLLTQEFMTPNQIAIRRQCSKQAISKAVVSLKKKGFLKKDFQGVDKSRWPSQPVNQVRLHGLEFNINILYKEEHYKKVLARTNVLTVDGNTVRLYADSVEVYGLNSYFGEDATKATSKAMAYFQRFFVKLENQLKIILVKPNSQNIKVVNAHYAEVGNEYAKECDREGLKLKVFAREDGKLWFTIDNSFNLHEAETLHPMTAKPDMDKVKEVFNQYRDGNTPTPNEVYGMLVEVLKHEREIAVGLNGVVKYLRSQLPKEPLEADGKELRDRPSYVG